MSNIEKIRQEIERRKKENMYDELPTAIGRYYEDRDLLAFIDSLPEGPAPKGYDEAYLNECIAKASKTWKGVDVDEYMDEIRGNRPKLSDNLEEAAEKYATEWHKNPDGSAWKPYFEVSAIKAFIAGAEWQKEQMMKSPLVSIGNTASEELQRINYENGKKDMKEQMMKEAVEGEVENASFGIVYLRKNLTNDGYSTGEKVRIIIVKEDER